MAVIRAVVAVAILVSAAANTFAQQQSCTFQLGFATLHDLIPDIVGGCLDNQSFDPVTGDALQHSTNGLLVWRKSDNFTAFTDGARSWVNGPFGLQERLNNQRFEWEPNPDGRAIVPLPQPGDRCHTAGLGVTLQGVDAGAGNLVGTFHFVNNLDVTCTLFGFPGAQLLDADGNPLPTNVVRAGGFFMNDPPPSTVNVPPQGAAQFRIHWEQVPVGNETTCPVSTSLQVTPPDEFFPLTIPIAIRACGGGRLDMEAVQVP